MELICDPEELLRVFLEIAAPHVEAHVSDSRWWMVRVVFLVVFLLTRGDNPTVAWRRIDGEGGGKGGMGGGLG